MIRPTRAWRTAAVLATASLALTACGSGSDSDSASESSSSSSSSAAAKKGDGTLTIGTLLPQTGDLAFLGPPEFAGAQTDKLLDANADVVLGAASSSVSLSVIDKITGAGVVQFSPANTSPTFDDAKTDPKNLYFRTAPSDVLQGAVMANTIIEDGKNNVAILARQDSYGELLAGQIDKGIKAGGGDVVTKQLYSADATNYTAEINKVAASKPDAIVLVGFDETKKIIPGLIAKGIGPKDQQIYFVDGNAADYSADFKKGTLTGVKATYPGAELTSDFKARMSKTDPKLRDFTYGPESYDAAVLSALAAIQAKTDDPTTFAPDIITVSEGGTECSTFKQCADLLKKGTDIDYQGVSGPVDMGKTGSPTKATIGIFEYEPTNMYKSVKYVTGVI